METEIALLHVLGDKGYYPLQYNLNNDHHLNLNYDSTQNTVYKKEKCKYVLQSGKI